MTTKREKDLLMHGVTPWDNVPPEDLPDCFIKLPNGDLYDIRSDMSQSELAEWNAAHDPNPWQIKRLLKK